MNAVFRGWPLWLGLRSSAGACELSISQGQIDYGQLNRTTLALSAGVGHLPTRTLWLQVDCPQPRELTLAYRALAASAQAFTLGAAHYRLDAQHATLDGVPVSLAVADRREAAISQPWLPEHTLVPLQAGAPVQGRQLRVQVTVSAQVPAVGLAVQDLTHWHANGVFEVAGQSRELHLALALAPAACTPRLGSGGRVDFARISTQRLADEAPSAFSRSVPLEVNCEGPTRFAMVLHDNRAGSADALEEGSLGIGNAALGSYVARVRHDATGDGRSLIALYSQSAGQQWQVSAQPQASKLYHAGRWLGFGLDASGPLAISRFSGTLQIDLRVAPKRQLKLTQETPIDGSATLEIVYL